MRLYRLFALASLPLLGACQSLGQSPASQPQRIAWEQRAPGCQGERCSLVNVDTLKFADQPRLDALIEQALLAMTQGSTDGAPPSSLRDYAQTLLRQTPEGRNLFTLLLQLMNRYCRGVIVEGVETLEEWRDVQNSPAFAAQGYFLSRPVPLDTLEEVILSL